MPSADLPASSPFIPVEILFEIISYLGETDRKTLVSTVIASKTLYAIAVRRLYHTIPFSSHHPKSPFVVVRPAPTIAQGGLVARTSGTVVKTGRSNKARLLDEVRVLDLDGRMDGRFWLGGTMKLPALRTLRIDMSLTNLRYTREDLFEFCRYGQLVHIKPTTIVLKHLRFHQYINVLDELPLPTIRDVTRIIYLVDYTAADAEFGLGRGSSCWTNDIGFVQWTSCLHYHFWRHVDTVDIVFWTDAPNRRFSAPSNVYTQMKQQREAETWLDRYIADIARDTILSEGTIKVNLVNTGSFDDGSIPADKWSYKVAQRAFIKKLNKHLAHWGKVKGCKAKKVRVGSISTWMGALGKGGVKLEDVLTDEEIRPWL